MALGILAADGQLPPEALVGVAVIGELGLDGCIRPVAGVAPMVMSMCSATDHDRHVSMPALAPLESVVVPESNVDEARIARPPRVRIGRTLRELAECLVGQVPWPDVQATVAADDAFPHDATVPELADVRGQNAARLGLELSAAGGHHLLLVGPPGSGKTMLAQRLPGILPPLDDRTSLEATLVRSAAGERLPAGGLVRRPPIRMPHHSASTISIIGGGSSTLRPGEVSLAHGGVLFQYRRRFSGPFLDRFDVRVLVHRPRVDDLLGESTGESSAVVRDRVSMVRRVALERQGTVNAMLAPEDLDRHAPIDVAATSLLRRELEAGRLTGRGLHRVRRVARTIADRDGQHDVVSEHHVAAALALRARIAPRRGDDLRHAV
ncbi:MAG: ATP-binding protein [Acidimicrobiia bacterium]|nr:ATP-binding protein [Acidimicrobiia bacterium]